MRCRQSPDASKPDGCDRQRGHVVGFAGRSASGRFQLRCFGIPSRRQISSAYRRKLGSERACQLRSPKEVARPSGHESSPRSTRPLSPHRPCVPGNAPILGFAVAGNLLRRNKSYSAGPIADHHEVCDQNRHDAASRGKKDSPFDKPPGLNPHRLSPEVDVTLDPPDGSGTKSRR